MVPGLSSAGLESLPCVCLCPRLPCSPPQQDEGLPVGLSAISVPWKNLGPSKGNRKSPGGLVEASASWEEAAGEEHPAAAPLDVSRLRSSSMEIREKGSEFLKEELYKAQKVGAPGQGWGLR